MHQMKNLGLLLAALAIACQPSDEQPAADQGSPIITDGPLEVSEAPSLANSINGLPPSLMESLEPLTAWRDTAELTLRQDSGRVAADSVFLRVREVFQARIILLKERLSGYISNARDDADFGGISDKLAEYAIRPRLAEGDLYFFVHEGVLLQWYGRFLTASMRDFLGLLSREQSAPTAGDAALLISVDELASRLAESDRLVSEYPDAFPRAHMQRQKLWYLTVYLGGLPNTPAFDPTSGVLKPELRRSYESFVQEHGTAASGIVVTEYLRLLESHDFQRGAHVQHFIDQVQVH